MQGHAQHGGVEKETAGARAVRLDTWLEAAGIDCVNFIKLDVDGQECAVLDGAVTTLSRHLPVIALEIAPYALRAYGTSAAELCNRLSRLGYSLSDERTGRPLPDAAELEEMLPPGASLNAVARPVRSLDR